MLAYVASNNTEIEGYVWREELTKSWEFQPGVEPMGP